jgi:hypothetical protein
MNTIKLTTRTINTLAKNALTLEDACNLSVDEWMTLIKAAGNGIGKATAAEIQDFVITRSVPTLKEYVPSKADKKAKEAIKDKASDLEQLVTYFIKDMTPEVVIKKIAVKSKDPRQVKLAEYVLSKYLMLPLESRNVIFYKFLTNIYRNTVSTSSREIILNKLLGELGGSLTDTMATLTSNWNMKKALSKLVGGGVNKNKLLANVFMVVMIDVLELMKLITSSTQLSINSKHASRVISLRTKELQLHPETDITITKFMLKTTRVAMETYPMTYSSDGILQNGKKVYSGHNLKGSPKQSEATFAVLNKIQASTYTIVPQMADKTHPIGMIVRSLAKKHFKHDNGQEFINYLDGYDGAELHPQVTITPDNGRMDFRGYPIGLGVGSMSWIMEQATKIMLTAEEAARLQARVDAFGTKKLKAKEEMEKLHYICALESYKAGKPTGVVTSNDFKGSGPLVQSLLTKNVEGLMMSIEYEGQEAGDPYRKVLKVYAEMAGLGTIEALAAHFNETEAEIRNWCKFHTQPMQYGSGAATSESNGRKEGSKLDQDIYMRAFAKALPHTWEALTVLKGHAKYLSKVAANSQSSLTSHLSYTTAAGVNCCITPLSDGKAKLGKDAGEGFIHSFRILGHNMNVPCKIIDTENHGVKTIAAASHQGDSALLWTMYKLFDHQMYTVHDDFRVSIRHEEELQQVAIAVVQMFWNDKDLFNRYIKNVYAPIATEYASFGYVVPEIPEIDWTKVTRVLF